MPYQFNMIFSEIFENMWHLEHNRGSKHLATRVQGAPTPWVRSLPRGPMVAPLHLFQLLHTLPPKKITSQLKPEFKLILLPFSIF